MRLNEKQIQRKLSSGNLIRFAFGKLKMFKIKN
jgi:hypothetical protein